MVALDEGMMVRSRPIVLADGDYLLPVYRETGHDTELVGADSTSLFLRFDPQTQEVEPVGSDPIEARQHSAVGGRD